MKVVLFCGGLGLRMRSGPDSLPKPMMPIGDRPVLWHVMRYYAHFGHTEFVLCLGYGADAVQEYFSREDAWSITFLDTGVESTIGQRLLRARPFLDGDEVFLANYGDVLTDASIDDMVAGLENSDAVGSLLAVRPPATFHVVEVGEGAQVTSVTAVAEADMRVNGGYFVFRQGIFDFLREDDDLVPDALFRAADAGCLRAVEHEGWWAPMDTLKERAVLEDLYRRGASPWTVWRDPVVPEAVPTTPVVEVPTEVHPVPGDLP